MAKKRAPKRRAPLNESTRQKPNPLTARGVTTIDYKDTALLRTFISERGKIRSRRVTGLTPQQQRQAAVAIRNAREMALLPFVEKRQ
jgi:small subunit ribosomal protein S18